MASFVLPYVGKNPTMLDLSNPYEDVFQEIPPFAIDKDTGKLLNPTKDPVLKKVGVKNVQEDIDSFADDVDIYKILERVALSGNPDYLNKRIGTFADFHNIPDNINDFDFYINSITKNVDSDVIKIALGEALSSDQVKNSIVEYVNKKISSSEVVKDE